MTSSETRLHSGEGTVGFEMVGDLFVNLAFDDQKDGQNNRHWTEELCLEGQHPRVASSLLMLRLVFCG